ncbi:MAG: hypothetical protein KBE23_06465 [Chloroflexi bacterium]|nr:hypothetical protein [Chloroflexota bacterium]MBP7042368.1 hypothetical protein [Chloroflexota bacterium]
MNPIWTHAVMGRKKQSGPWWLAGDAPAPLAAYQPLGAASQAASYTNIANPGVYTVVPTVEPAWSGTDGWIFSGSQYMDTTLAISPWTTKTVLCRFSNATVQGDGTLVGVTQTTSAIMLIPNSAVGGGSHVARIGRAPTYYAPPLTQGVLGASAQNGYVNGVLDGKVCNPYTGGTTKTVHIGCLWAGTAPTGGTYFIGHIQAVVMYDYELTADQMAAVSAAMAALQKGF